MRRLASARVSALVAVAFTVAAAPAVAQAVTVADVDAVVVAFAVQDAAAVIDGVSVAVPVRIHPKAPEDIPPSLHEQIRLLKARLDNAYPEASDARKLNFIADYLGISFHRLWNAYHPDRPQRPDARPVDVRPVDARPVDRARPERVRPVDPQRARPAAITRIRPDVRPAPAARPVRPGG